MLFPGRSVRTQHRHLVGLPERGGEGDRVLRGKVGFGERALLRDEPEDLAHLLATERFSDVFERPELHRLDGRRDGREPGDDDHVGARPPLADLAQEVETALAGHLEVGEDDVALAPLEDLEGLAGRRGHLDLMALIGEERRELLAEHLVIIDDQQPHEESEGGPGLKRWGRRRRPEGWSRRSSRVQLLSADREPIDLQPAVRPANGLSALREDAGRRPAVGARR